MLQRLFRKPAFELFQQPKPPPLEAVRAADAGSRRTAPDTAIAHDPTLVAHLHRQHAWLQQSLEAIQADVMSGELVYAQRALTLFRRALTTHLLEENVKMYTYVTKCLAHDASAVRSLLSVKSEMDEAGAVATGFADAHVQAELTPSNQLQFLTELQIVRTTLSDRIDWEENSLYSLYLPPQAYL